MHKESEETKNNLLTDFRIKEQNEKGRSTLLKKNVVMLRLIVSVVNFGGQVNLSEISFVFFLRSCCSFRFFFSC